MATIGLALEPVFNALNIAFGADAVLHLLQGLDISTEAYSSTRFGMEALENDLTKVQDEHNALNPRAHPKGTRLQPRFRRGDPLGRVHPEWTDAKADLKRHGYTGEELVKQMRAWWKDRKLTPVRSFNVWADHMQDMESELDHARSGAQTQGIDDKFHNPHEQWPATLLEGSAGAEQPGMGAPLTPAPVHQPGAPFTPDPGDVGLDETLSKFEGKSPSPIPLKTPREAPRGVDRPGSNVLDDERRLNFDDHDINDTFGTSASTTQETTGIPKTTNVPGFQGRGSLSEVAANKRLKVREMAMRMDFSDEMATNIAGTANESMIDEIILNPDILGHVGEEGDELFITMEDGTRVSLDDASFDDTREVLLPRDQDAKQFGLRGLTPKQLGGLAVATAGAGALGGVIGGAIARNPRSGIVILDRPEGGEGGGGGAGGGATGGGGGGGPPGGPAPPPPIGVDPKKPPPTSSTDEPAAVATDEDEDEDDDDEDEFASFPEDVKQMYTSQIDAFGELRPMLPVLGSSVLLQDQLNKQKQASDAISMGMSKPKNWPLGNTDNRLWVDNMVREGIRWGGNLNIFPPTYPGGTIDEGNLPWGSYKRHGSQKMAGKRRRLLPGV